MSRISAEEKRYYALTKRAFDILAPFYNLITLPLLRVREKVVDCANVSKNATVLDVATGTGQQVFAFAKRGCDVIGVDLTEAMLDIARKHNRDGLVKFEVSDATRLRFEANRFDITCVSFALHDMPLTIREQVLKEMARVTNPNGMIVIVDYELPRRGIGRTLIYRLITLYEGEYYKQFIVSDLEALLKDTNIEVMKKSSILMGAGRILLGTKKVQMIPESPSR